MYFFLGASSGSSPSRLKTRHKLSTHRLYPRLLGRAHSSTIPSFGFLRRIFWMSFISSGDAGSDGYGVFVTGRPTIQWCRQIVFAKSKYRSGFCYTSGWRGTRRIFLRTSSGSSGISCPVLFILSMRLEVPFGWFAAAMLYHVESSGLFLLPLLSNMDCSSINTTLAFWEKGRQSSPICDMIMSFQNTTILDTLYGSLAIAVIFIGIHASGNTNHCNRRLKGAFL